MKCFECGAIMRAQNEAYLYDRYGMKVTLLGLEVRRCGKCGDFEVVIPEVEELDRVITKALIKKDTPLTGPEARFLRKSLGWSATDLAHYLGTTKETISRWETGKRKMNPAADRALRLTAAHQRPIEDYSLIDIMKSICDGPPRPLGTLKVAFQGESCGKPHWARAVA